MANSESSDFWAVVSESDEPGLSSMGQLSSGPDSTVIKELSEPEEVTSEAKFASEIKVASMVEVAWLDWDSIFGGLVESDVLHWCEGKSEVVI